MDQYAISQQKDAKWELAGYKLKTKLLLIASLQQLHFGPHLTKQSLLQFFLRLAHAHSLATLLFIQTLNLLYQNIKNFYNHHLHPTNDIHTTTGQSGTPC